MAFEEEVFPLMVLGVLAVSLLEIALGWALLKGRSSARKLLLWHVFFDVGRVFLPVSMCICQQNGYPGRDLVDPQFRQHGPVWPSVGRKRGVSCLPGGKFDKA